jgi:hyperosmotically inducible protein
MYTKLVTAVLLLAGSLLAPIAVRAADSDADRAHPEAFVKDSAITTKVKAKLAAENMSSLAHIRVDTDRNGMVVLSGTAHSQAPIDKAVAIARGTEGVISVQNHIKVKADD